MAKRTSCTKVFLTMALLGFGLSACETPSTPVPPTATAAPVVTTEDRAIVLGDISDDPGEVIEGTQPLADYIAAQLGDFGITVNALAPGYVETELIGSYPEERKNIIIEQNPVGRFCSLEEVGALVAYLCSRQAAFINGAIISMDGGRQDFYWGKGWF